MSPSDLIANALCLHLLQTGQNIKFLTNPTQRFLKQILPAGLHCRYHPTPFPCLDIQCPFWPLVLYLAVRSNGSFPRTPMRMHEHATNTGVMYKTFNRGFTECGFYYHVCIFPLSVYFTHNSRFLYMVSLCVRVGWLHVWEYSQVTVSLQMESQQEHTGGGASSSSHLTTQPITESANQEDKKTEEDRCSPEP